MKKNRVFGLLLALLVLFVSCEEEPSHIHTFEETTLQCSCGVIDEGVVAYVGDSYEHAKARFKTLQGAVDYLAEEQRPRAISSDNTIHGYGSTIQCTGLTINNVEVAFDFSDSTVTFTGTAGIVVNGGSVEISGNEIKGNENIGSIITVQSGSLTTKIDFEGTITVNSSATMTIESGEVKLEGVVSDNPTAQNITLTTATITIPETVIEQIKEHLSEESTSKPEVPNHTHDYQKDLIGSKEATCTEEGYNKMVCDCGLSYYETVGKKDHVYDQTVAETKYMKTAATCENKAVYYKSCVCGECGDTDTFESGDPLGHSYGTPEYEWSENECTATRTCTRTGCTHSETETATGVYSLVNDSSCSATGTGKYTATFTNSAFTIQTTNVTIAKKPHTYNQEVVNAKYLKQAATCTAKAVYYKSCICGECGDTDTFESGDSLGHSYGTPKYDWVGDKCTATRTCTRTGCTHSETETATGVYSLVNDSSCSATGTGKYTATFTNSAFTIQTTNVTIAKKPHTYNQEVVNTKYLKQAATCTAKAVYYKSCVCGECGDAETFESGTPLGHSYGTPKYVWVGDKCTATRTCTRTGCTHSETETATGVYSLVNDSSCSATGTGKYTATFTNSAFTTQTTNVTVAKKAHTPGSSAQENYKAETCGADGGYDTVVRCSVCSEIVSSIHTTIPKTGNHTYNKEVVNSSHLKQAATCTSSAVYYKSCECGANGSETFESGNPLGHSYKNPTYSWSVSDYTCTATRVCRNDSTHKETETVQGSYSIVNDSSCTATGTGKYTATFTNSAFATQTTNVTIAKKAHTPASPVQENYEAETCGTDGCYDTVVRCSVCNEILSSVHTTIPKTEAHVYNKEVTSSTYLKQAATCTTSAVYYKSCECGAKGSETFESGSPLGHSPDKNDICTRCDYYLLLDYITFENENKKIKNCDAAISGTFTVPDYVTEIASDAFAGCTGLTEVVLNCKEGDIKGMPWGAPVDTVITWKQGTLQDTFLAAAVNDYIEDEDDWPYGLSVSVYSKSNRINYNYYGGISQMNKNSTAKTMNSKDVRHYIFSITKTFTAAAILKLVDDNKLSLDTPISAFFTTNGTGNSYKIDSALLPFLFKDGDSANAPTVEQVLTHKSGISDFFGGDLFANMLCDIISQKTVNNIISERLIIAPLLKSNGITFKTKSFAYPFKDSWDPQAILNFIAKPAVAPGTYSYSTMDYVILGLIIEKASGETVEEYLKDNFFDVMGISNLKLAPREINGDEEFAQIASQQIWVPQFEDILDENELLVTLAKSYFKDAGLYVPDLDTVEYYDLSNTLPKLNKYLGQVAWTGGAMTGNSEDVCKFGYDLLSSNGESSLDKVRSMMFDSVKTVSNGTYAYGIEKCTIGGKTYYGHYGQGAGTHTLMMYNVETDTCYVIFSDMGHLDMVNNKLGGCIDINDLLRLLETAVENIYNER